MMKTGLANLAGKSIGILGLGISGLACLSFLLKHQIKPFVMDAHLQSPGVLKALNLASDLVVYGLPQAELTSSPIFQADLLIVSPGIPLSSPMLVAAKARGIEIIGDIELFARLNEKPVIAMTGSNGKSTVTKLVTQLLQDGGYQAVCGGNIGIGVMDLLSSPYDIAVLELSSFQLETTHSLQCVSATVLNISEDHMDRYQSLQDYIAAKQRIYRHADLCVYHRAEVNTMPAAGATNGSGDLLAFGLTPATNIASTPSLATIIDQHFVLVSGEGTANQHVEQICPVSRLALFGQHNQLNALAAIALVSPFKLDNAAIERTLQQFVGLPHRCSLVAEINGVKWINDSKATNVGATVAALQGIGPQVTGQVILLAGGTGKDADFSPLQQPLKQYVGQLITFGRDGGQIAQLVAGTHQVDSLATAVKTAKALAQPGDCVLLSPACASFDMFNGFEHRGDTFSALVLSSQANTLTKEPIDGN